MRYKLFLDDERYPPDKTACDKYWRIARNYHDAVWYVQTYGVPYHIAFDHDLGNETMNGLDFAKWFCYYVMDNGVNLPNNFTYDVHSMNPVGAENIKSFMDNFMRDGYI